MIMVWYFVFTVYARLAFCRSHVTLDAFIVQVVTSVMGEDEDLQFGVPYRLPPRIAPGNHTVLLPNTGNHYFSPGRGAVPVWPQCRVTPVRRIRMQTLTGSILPLSLRNWRHASRSTTPRCDALIGGKAVTLASRRSRQRNRGSSRSRARTY